MNGDGVDTGALVKGAASGDRADWEALVARFSALVWAIARSFRLDDAAAADVSQTTWLRLVEHLDTLREPERVGAWLATTARRESLRSIRLAARARPTDDAFLLDGADVDAGQLGDALLRDERDGLLWAAIDALPDRCRRLLRLLMNDPRPGYDQVSAALEIPIGSIGPTRQRCLDRLRRGISAELGDSV